MTGEKLPSEGCENTASTAAALTRNESNLDQHYGQEEIDYSYYNDFDRRFDEDFRDLFTECLKKDSNFGRELWSSLANVSWYHKDDPEETACRRSFRGAGTLIAIMEGKDIYTKWYCSGPYETVSGYISSAMASKGWRCEPDGYRSDK
ncbi:MAG: hypothetical protein FWC03_01750 [Treponema sp.]|nr:hypothetical protein [Treponema sp.]